MSLKFPQFARLKDTYRKDWASNKMRKDIFTSILSKGIWILEKSPR